MALAAGVGSSSLARADALPPKVCVVVASDPDVALRDAARAFSNALGARTDVRTVADADTVSALRGEPVTSTWADQRKSLHANDQDTPALVLMGEALGCAYWVELAARPAGIAVRGFDVVGHAFVSPREVAVVDLPVINATVQQLLDLRVPAMTPATTSATTSTTISTTTTSTTNTGAATPATTATTTPATVPPGAIVTPPARNTAPPKDKGPGVLGWVIAGGAVAALLATFIAVAATSGPNVPTISVVHPPPGVAP